MDDQQFQDTGSVKHTRKQTQDRTRVEEELQFRNLILSTLLEASIDGILVVDKDARIIMYNQRFVEMWGVPRELIEKKDDKPVLEFVANKVADPSSFLLHVRYLYENKRKTSRDEIVLKDGRVFDRYSASMFGQDDEYCGRAWYFRDITDRKQAQDRMGFLSAVVSHDVSERNAAQKALRESNERFSRLSDASFEGILLTKEGNVVDLNDQLAEMLQYARSAMVGMDVLEFVAPESREIVLEHMRSGNEEPYEFMAMRRDGSAFPVEARAKSIRSSGENVRVIAIRDVTGRKQFEEELQFRNLILSTQLEASVDGVLVVDDDARIVMYNQRFVEMWDVPPKLIEKKDDKPVLEFVANKVADPVSFLRDVQHLYEHKRKTSRDEIVLKGGKVYDRYSAPMFGQDDEYCGRAWYFRDITDQKLAEDRLSFLSTLVQQSPTSIVLTDASGAIEYVNPRFTKLTGYTLEEVRGKNPSILKSGQTSAREYQQLWETILAGSEWHGEFHNKRKDGSLYWESASISPIITGGTITHFLAIKEDITEQKKMGERLSQMQKMESMGTLAGGMAHDFNNILNIILGHLLLIEMRKGDPSAVRRSTNAMKEAAQRGADLVHQILTFARKGDVDLEPISVNESVADIVRMLQETFPKTIEIQLQLENRIPLITMDRPQLHQVLLNLCINARDAIVEAAGSAPVAGTLRIATSLAEGKTLRAMHVEATAPHYVCVSVSDSGTGMDKETRQRVFEPFFTTKKAGKGTGLGLSVVYGVVKSHHGFIDVQSKPGEGATFVMYLPIPEVAVARGYETTDTAEDIRGGSETILIIEDEKETVELMVELLTKKGYSVLTAYDGLQALEIFSGRKDEIGLVLTDTDLRKLEGHSLIVRLLELKPDTKVVVTSGYLMPGQKEELSRAGARAIITKPYTPDEVLRIVRDVLDGNAP